MGVVARKNCPHCRTQNVAFDAKYQWETVAEGRRGLFRCAACGEGVVWEYMTGESRDIIQLGGDADRRGIVFLRQWPNHPRGDAPEDTPPIAANYFVQATSSLEAGNFDAAGMMFRKSLESATKILDASLGQMRLVERIDQLVRTGKLTADLGEWAHEVRLGGNEAAHEDEPFTFEVANDLRNFIENFLRYAFTLPSAVRRRTRPEDGQSQVETVN